MAAKATVRVACGCCRGSGTVPLAPEYLATYRALLAAGEACAAELAPKLGCKPTATNNRLDALERHGLATSRTVPLEGRGRPRRVFAVVVKQVSG